MPSRRLKVAVGLLLTRGVAAFLPFADVEELSPKPLGDFCDPGEGVRHCEGTTHRVLEDGGVVKLKWGMHTDPDRILSLDTEHKNGVRILKCTPSSLELMLPVSHTQHARVGEIIVASHFVHGCEHLLQVVDQEKEGDEPMNYNLYHRVVKVHSVQWRNADGTLAAGSAQGKAAHVKLWTKELPSLGHAIGSIAYDFDYTPLEATEESGLDPEQTTSDSDYYKGKWIDRPSTEHLSARRLNVQDMQPETLNADDFSPPTDNYHGDENGPKSDYGSDLNFKADGGHPTFGGTTVTTDDVKSLLNFQPKKVANFGWNWNFKMKAHQDISFNYTVPGSRMYLIIKKPYFKAHSKLRIRFRSYMPHESAEDTFFTDNTWVSLRSKGGKRAPLFANFQPRVKWEAAFKGKAKVEVGILAQMKAHRSISENPLEMIKIPVLHKLWKPKWFGSLDFNLGNLPVTVSPGIQFKAKFFHYGTFRGSLSVGVKSHPVYHPRLLFDSFTGLRVDLHSEMRETTVTPPNWMVSTSHFECGIALEPTIWIKGHMGQITQNTKFAAALRPYFNMTITRAQHVQQQVQGEPQKELVLYPFRIVGLPTSPSKRYKVRVETEMPYQYCTDVQSTPTQAPSYQHNLRQQSGGYGEYGYGMAQNGYGEAQNQQTTGAVNNAPVKNLNGYGTSELGEDKVDCALYKRRIDSSEGLSFGEVEFHDPFTRFSFGLISQRMLLLLDLKVQLIEVTMDSTGAPFERKSDQQVFKCKTVVNGVCMPSPLVKEIYWTDGEKVKIYLHAIWKENPRPWFASRIRGVAASFPEVVVNKDYIQSVVPDYKISNFVNNGAVAGVGAQLPLVLVLRHAFKSYPVLLNKHNGYVPGINSSSMKSDQTIELGASFLSTWDRTCVMGTSKCDPKLVLYHGDQEVASANLPHIPWNSHQRMAGTYEASIGNERTARIVPVTVALKATFASKYRVGGWGHVGMVRMKFALSNLAVWNRWISPAQFTAVQPGASFRLAWALNEADPYKKTNFNLIVSKGAPAGAVAEPGQQHLRTRVGYSDNAGRTWFQQVSSTPLSLKPLQEQAGGVHRLRFEYDIQFGEFVSGDTVIVGVQWVDDNGQTHTMDASPFLISAPVTAAATAPAAAAIAATAAVAAVAPASVAVAPSLVDSLEATAAPTKNPDSADFDTDNPELTRKLFDMAGLFGQKGGWQKGANGQSTWSDQVNDNVQQPAVDQCIRQDLNFAFGAGIMFRAFVKDLSLPPDLPVLGAIQMAPELGTPWQTIEGFMSAPADLNSKLPALLCRHGVCSATLPGCPEFNHDRRYYPEIILKFKHTLGYPRGDNLTASKDTAWVPGLQTALSYTFAIMPEIIQIIVHYSKKIPKKVKYHNVISGDDACENRGFSMTRCETVGCCKWDALYGADGACRTAVGTGPCWNKDAKVGTMIKDVETAPVYAPAVAAAPVVAAAVPAGLPAFPQPAIVAATALPPTAAPLATVPVITPLTSRRLNEEEGEEEDGEPRASHITVSFKEGVRYQVDNLLIDEMRKQGMFKEFEAVPSGDKPLIIESYTIRDLQPPTGPDYSQKDSLPAGLFSVSQSPLQILAGSAFVGCVLLGVALVARRAQGSYQRVADSAGPVE